MLLTRRKDLGGRDIKTSNVVGGIGEGRGNTITLELVVPEREMYCQKEGRGRNKVIIVDEGSRYVTVV